MARKTGRVEVVLVAFGALWAPGCSDADGQAWGSAQQAVLNGTDAPGTVAMTEAELASIGHLKIGDPAGYTNCTGALVAPKVVLTGAHCLDDPNTTYITFDSGPDYKAPDQQFPAVSWHMHPEYPGNSSKYDIGVVLLQDDAEVAGLTPIPLNRVVQSLVGQAVQAVGYGRTNPQVSGNSLRKWTTLQVTDEDALRYQATGTSSGMCIGDSGGPLLWQHPERGLQVMGTLSKGNSATCLGNFFYARTDGTLEFLAKYVPEPPNPAPGGGGASGAGAGVGGNAGSSAGTSGGAGTGGAPASGGGPNAGAGNLTPGGDSGSDSGCAVATRAGASGAWWLLVGALGLSLGGPRIRSRRRRGARSPRSPSRARALPRPSPVWK